MKTFFLYLLFCAAPAIAAPQYWNLPVTLEDSNSSISFKVDSTWHTIHGTAHKVTGELHLKDLADFHSVAGIIEFPVRFMETGSESRDEEMREVMAENTYENVSFRIDGGVDVCEPNKLPCKLNVPGVLSIRGTDLPVMLEGDISDHDSRYHVQLKTKIRWDEYGVEDPSILIAKLDEVVEIEISASWRSK